MNIFLTQKNSAIRLILGMLIAVASAGVIFVVGIWAGAYFFGKDLAEFVSAASSAVPGDENTVRYLLVLQSLAIFIAPAAVIAIAMKTKDEPFLQWSTIKSPISIVLAVLVIVAAIPLINLFAEVNRQLLDFVVGADNWMAKAEMNAQVLTEFILSTSNYSYFLLNVFVIAVVPAFSEELFFRGVLQSLFHRRLQNQHLAVIITAVLFSALHLQFYGFIPRFIMGIFLGYLYVWFGNLLVPILVHFANNAIAVSLYYMIHNGMLPEYVETIGSNTETIGSSIVSVVGVLFLLWLLEKKSKIPIIKPFLPKSVLPPS